MRWLCPHCRRAISFAFSDCPFCAQTESATEAKSASAKPPPPSPTQPAASGEAVVRKLVPGPASQSPPVRGSPARAMPESQLYRGVRFGIGFALGVAVLLLLLVGFWLWLSGGQS